MGKPCEACESSSERPNSGAYNFRCVECCARLVLATHPDKDLAAAQLAAIKRFPGNPGREKVLASVAQMLTKRP